MHPAAVPCRQQSLINDMAPTHMNTCCYAATEFVCALVQDQLNSGKSWWSHSSLKTLLPKSEMQLQKPWHRACRPFFERKTTGLYSMVWALAIPGHKASNTLSGMISQACKCCSHLARQKSWRWPTLRFEPASAMCASRPPSFRTASLSCTSRNTCQTQLIPICNTWMHGGNP